MTGMPMNTHYWFIREVHESWERDQRQISCPTSPHSTKPNPNLAQNWVVLGLFWPKVQLCRIAHCKNASKTLLLVHHKGAWVLTGEPKTCFLANHDTTKRDQPMIWSNIECVCGYFDQKHTYVGSYTVRLPIQTHHCPRCWHAMHTLAACSRWLRRAGRPPAPSHQKLPRAISATLALAPRWLNPLHMHTLLLLSYFGSSVCSHHGYCDGYGCGYVRCHAFYPQASHYSTWCWMVGA